MPLAIGKPLIIADADIQSVSVNTGSCLCNTYRTICRVKQKKRGTKIIRVINHKIIVTRTAFQSMTAGEYRIFELLWKNKQRLRKRKHPLEKERNIIKKLSSFIYSCELHNKKNNNIQFCRFVVSKNSWNQFYNSEFVKNFF